MTIIWLIMQTYLFIFDVFLFMVLADRLVFLALGHLLLSGVFSLSFGCSLTSLFPRKGTTLLGGLLAFCIPIVGMCCSLIIAFLLLFKSLPKGDLLKEFEKYTNLSNVAVANEKPSLITFETLRSTHRVEPFVDMLSTPNSHLKQSILNAIAHRGNTRLYPVIQAAIEDPRTEIHQFAIAKIQKLKHDYERRIIKATETVNVIPTSTEAHYRLALAYSQYITSGLMDKSVTSFYQAQLHKEYKKILTLTHSLMEEYNLSNLGQLSLQIGRWDEAEAAFEKALELRPDNPEANLDLIKLFYEQKRFNKMFECFHRIREFLILSEETDPSLVKLTKWWLSTRMRIDKVH